MMLCRRQLEHLVSQFVLRVHGEEHVALDEGIAAAIHAHELEFALLQFLVVSALGPHTQVVIAIVIACRIVVRGVSRRRRRTICVSCLRWVVGKLRAD